MSSTPSGEFRRAGSADAETAREIVRSAYTKWIPIIGREPRPMMADYDRAVTDHDVDLLLVGPKIVGFIETMMRDNHLWIENIAVRPEEQGKGFGWRLLVHAEGLALAMRRREIRLLTNSAFESNVVLYEKAGYIITASEPFLSGTTIYMSKYLTG